MKKVRETKQAWSPESESRCTRHLIERARPGNRSTLRAGGCQGSCRLNVSFVSVSPGVRSAWQSWAAWPSAATDPNAGTAGTDAVPLSALRAQSSG